MVLKPQGSLRRAVLPIGLVVLGVLTWILLSSLRPAADWLVVRAPRYAVEGEMLRLHVEVLQPAPAGVIAADLHWNGKRLEPGGFLSAGPAHRLEHQGGVFEFPITVRPTNHLGFVHAVIYLSQTGRWQDRTRVAVTAPIPVRAPATTGTSPRRVRIPAYREDVERKVDGARGVARPRVVSPAKPDPVARLVGVFAFTGAAALCVWLVARLPPLAQGRRGSERFLWGGLAVLLLTAAAFEGFGLNDALGNSFRRLALRLNVYYLRVPFQKAVITTVVTVSAGLLVLLLRRPVGRCIRFALVGGLFLLGVSAVNALSLHEVDTMLGWRLLGITMLEGLKLLGVIVVCLAAIYRLREQPGR